MRKKMVMILVVIAVLLTACSTPISSQQEEASTYYGWNDGEGKWMKAFSEEMPSGNGLVTVIDCYGHKDTFPGHWDISPQRKSQCIILKGQSGNIVVTAMPEGFQILWTLAE